MTWLLKLAVSNPWVLLAIVLAIFGFGAMTGGSAAWWIQGVKVTYAQQETKTVRQDFKQYQQDQKDLVQVAKDKADQQREKASSDYEHVSNLLSDEINRGVVYQRCVAAGKCGVRHDAMPACSGIRIPTSVGTNAAIPNAVPTGKVSTAGEDQVVNDCAVTTLMLNQLQADIEKQPGFKE